MLSYYERWLFGGRNDVRWKRLKRRACNAFAKMKVPSPHKGAYFKNYTVKLECKKLSRAATNKWKYKFSLI